MPAKSPPLLTAEQRAAFVQVPPDLPDREIARHYTLSAADLAVIARRRQPQNRLGFAVQLCLLRFPGRTLTEVGIVPPRVLTYIAAQVQADPASFALYGQREQTLYEHLTEIRQTFGYRDCSGLDYLHLARLLLPEALAQTHSVPLIEAALTWLRAQRLIAPGMTTLERLVSIVQRRATRQVTAWLVAPLTATHRTQLDALFQRMSGRARQTRWAWLREPPGTPSATSLRHILDRLAFLDELRLPPLSARVHRNRVLLLARHASRYEAQPLGKLREPRRYALLVAYLAEFAQDCTDQAVEMFERLMTELLRKGERRQEIHFTTNAGSMNASLASHEFFEKVYV